MCFHFFLILCYLSDIVFCIFVDLFLKLVHPFETAILTVAQCTHRVWSFVRVCGSLIGLLLGVTQSFMHLPFVILLFATTSEQCRCVIAVAHFTPYASFSLPQNSSVFLITKSSTRMCQFLSQ